MMQLALSVDVLHMHNTLLSTVGDYFPTVHKSICSIDVCARVSMCGRSVEICDMSLAKCSTLMQTLKEDEE